MLWPVTFGENWHSKMYAGHYLRACLFEGKASGTVLQRETPSQMLQLNIKRLGRIVGVGHQRGSVDDTSQMDYAAIFLDETAESAVEVLWSVVAWYEVRGVRIERVLTLLHIHK